MAELTNGSGISTEDLAAAIHYRSLDWVGRVSSLFGLISDRFRADFTQIFCADFTQNKNRKYGIK
jgi:hypothetical protein